MAILLVIGGTIVAINASDAPADSPLRRAILADGPALYWPLEDGVLASGLPDGVPLVASGPVDLATAPGPAGSRPLPSRLLDDAGQVAASVAMGATSTYQVEVVLSVDTRSATSGGSILHWATPGNATLAEWDIAYVADSRALAVDSLTAAGTISNRLGYLFESGDGGFHYVSISVVQSGDDVVLSLSVDGVGRGTVTIPSASVAPPQNPTISRPGSSSAPASGPAVVGHVAFFNRIRDAASHYRAMLGTD